eukprot:6492656-Prorocentrum_lima.AAC.1
MTEVKKGGRRLPWVKGEQIGEGTYGRVFKGLNKRTGGLVAIKQVALAGGTEEEVRSLESEVRLMRELKHEHIVRYLGTDRSGDDRH